MKKIVIMGTESSGKSTFLNLVTSSMIAPTSVQHSGYGILEIQHSSEVTPFHITKIETDIQNSMNVCISMPMFAHIINQFHFFKFFQRIKIRKILKSFNTFFKMVETITEIPSLTIAQSQESLDFKKIATESIQKIKSADVIFFIFSAQETNPYTDIHAIEFLVKSLSSSQKDIVFLLNQCDLFANDSDQEYSLNKRINQIQKYCDQEFQRYQKTIKSLKIYPVHLEALSHLLAFYHTFQKIDQDQQNFLKKRMKSHLRKSTIPTHIPIDISQWKTKYLFEILPMFYESSGLEKPLADLCQTLNAQNQLINHS